MVIVSCVILIYHFAARVKEQKIVIFEQITNDQIVYLRAFCQFRKRIKISFVLGWNCELGSWMWKGSWCLCRCCKIQSMDCQQHSQEDMKTKIQHGA